MGGPVSNLYEHKWQKSQFSTTDDVLPLQEDEDSEPLMSEDLQLDNSATEQRPVHRQWPSDECANLLKIPKVRSPELPPAGEVPALVAVRPKGPLQFGLDSPLQTMTSKRKAVGRVPHTRTVWTRLQAPLHA